MEPRTQRSSGRDAGLGLVGEWIAEAVSRIKQNTTGRPVASVESPLVRARVIPGRTSTPLPLERVARLTPYEIQDVADDALRSGPGTKLQLVVDRPGDDTAVREVQRAFGWLAARGVVLEVTRDRPQL